MARALVVGLLLAAGVSAQDSNKKKLPAGATPIGQAPADATVLIDGQWLPKGFSLSSRPWSRIPGQRHRITTPQIGGKCGFANMGTGAPPRQTTMLNCTSTYLPSGIPDLRGDWVGKPRDPATGIATMALYKEHIEQCDDRIVITNHKSTQDFVHGDNTFEHGLQDFDEMWLPNCRQVVAAGQFDGNCFVIDYMAEPNGQMFHQPDRRCKAGDGRMTVEFGLGRPSPLVWMRQKAGPVETWQDEHHRDFPNAWPDDHRQVPAFHKIMHRHMMEKDPSHPKVLEHGKYDTSMYDASNMVKGTEMYDAYWKAVEEGKEFFKNNQELWAADA